MGCFPLNAKERFLVADQKEYHTHMTPYQTGISRLNWMEEACLHAAELLLLLVIHYQHQFTALTIILIVNTEIRHERES
jgi:hypothetical protein